jgi:hypothetical protein
MNPTGANFRKIADLAKKPFVRFCFFGLGCIYLFIYFSWGRGRFTRSGRTRACELANPARLARFDIGLALRARAVNTRLSYLRGPSLGSFW